MAIFPSARKTRVNPQIPSFAAVPSVFLVTGGTGFIGTSLVATLLSQGHQVIVLTRQPLSGNDPTLRYIANLEELRTDTHIDIVINLAGEPLVSGRWTDERKKLFLRSRVDTTLQLLTLCASLTTKPRLLINGSAIGYYGPHGDEVLDESGTINPSFSHELCAAWENAASRFDSIGVRVVMVRTGIVLGHGGGSFPKLKQSFNFGVESWLGSGQQYLSWIHIDDLIGLMAWASTHDAVNGPINGTAPNPVTHRQFAAALAQRKRTFLSLAVPAKLLSLAMGEMAEELLLTGQRVVPAAITRAGYDYLFPDVGAALDQLVGNTSH